MNPLILSLLCSFSDSLFRIWGKEGFPPQSYSFRTWLWRKCPCNILWLCLRWDRSGRSSCLQPIDWIPPHPSAFLSNSGQCSEEWLLPGYNNCPGFHSSFWTSTNWFRTLKSMSSSSHYSSLWPEWGRSPRSQKGALSPLGPLVSPWSYTLRTCVSSFCDLRKWGTLQWSCCSWVRGSSGCPPKRIGGFVPVFWHTIH